MLLPVPRSRYPWKISIRMGPYPGAMPDRQAPLVHFRARERAAAVPTPDPVRQGDHPPGRPRDGLRGPRERRGVPGRRQGAPAGAVAEQPPVVGREPPPLRVLARAADAEGRERLHRLRPPPPRHRRDRVTMRATAAAALAVAALILAGCGNDDDKASETTTAPASTTPKPVTTTPGKPVVP